MKTSVITMSVNYWMLENTAIIVVGISVATKKGYLKAYINYKMPIRKANMRTAYQLTN